MVFSPFSNTTIKLRGVAGYSDDGLNDVPVEVVYELRAMLEEEKQDPTIQSRPGLDQPTAKFKGYIVDELPPSVSLPQDAIVVFDSLGERHYKVIAALPSPYFDEVGLFGFPIALQ